jgi:dolichol kinase
MARKIFHILMVLPFVVLGFFIDNYLPRSVYIIISVIMLIVFLALDFYRLKNEHVNQKILQQFHFMLKKEEEKKIISSIWGPIDLLVLVIFFSKPTVVATLVIGGLSDPIAAMIGMKYGKKKNKLGKTWAGSIAHFVTCVVVITLALWVIHFAFPFWAILVLSFIAAMTERYFPYWDDNVVVPMVFAVCFEGAMLLFK